MKKILIIFVLSLIFALFVVVACYKIYPKYFFITQPPWILRGNKITGEIRAYSCLGGKNLTVVVIPNNNKYTTFEATSQIEQVDNSLWRPKSAISLNRPVEPNDSNKPLKMHLNLEGLKKARQKKQLERLLESSRK